MLGREVTQQNITRVQVLGFGLVIVLLLTAGFVAIHNVRSIREATSTLVREQTTTQRLIDEVLQTREVLNGILFGIAATGQDWNRRDVMSGLSAAETELGHVREWAAGMPEQELWHKLQEASRGFTSEARRLLEAPVEDPEPSRELLKRHEDVVTAATTLIRTASERSSQAQGRIEKESSALLTESAILLGAGLLLSVFGALLTLHVTGDLMQRMELQNLELARVTWQMLENQETTARRFSHELHDELGQTLAALRANLAALRAADPSSDSRLRDCLQLTGEAIGNVREMSQLLRPTILDDFGLGAGLRWLSEGFMQRTEIEVEYSGDFAGRLLDETETHLFRIAQEALTNVARHSGATRVKVGLRVEGGLVTLRVEDNGKGIDRLEAIGPGHLGLVGMRARARSAGGELEFHTGQGRGFTIEVKVPARLESHEQAEDSHIVG